MYDPALQVSAVLKNDDGFVVAGVSPQGKVFSWGLPEVGVPFDRNDLANWEPVSWPAWRGREASAIEWPTSSEKRTGVKYVIVSTQNERYHLPAKRG